MARFPKPFFTLFKTEICDFSYRIYDLTKNSIPYLTPDPCNISSLLQTNVKGNVYFKCLYGKQGFCIHIMCKKVFQEKNIGFRHFTAATPNEADHESVQKVSLGF